MERSDRKEEEQRVFGRNSQRAGNSVKVFGKKPCVFRGMRSSTVDWRAAEGESEWARRS